MTEGAFNTWAAHKRLVVAHEIYSGQSRKAYNLLKSVITDDVLRVSKKFVPEYEVTNHAHIVACSNSLRALGVAAEDRRWLIR